jgi:sulfate permease, SulP family
MNSSSDSTNIDQTIHEQTKHNLPNDISAPTMQENALNIDENDEICLTEFQEFTPPDIPIRKRILKYMKQTIKDELASYTYESVINFILPWRHNYSWSKFSNDLVAGALVAVMLIPQSLAYAILNGADSIYGLWTSITPLIVYALFSTSSSMAVGTVALNAIVSYDMATKFLASKGVSQDDSTYSSQFMSIQFVLSALSGLSLLLMYVFECFWVADLLSWSVMSGFTIATACAIIISQIPDLFGVKNVTATQFFPRFYQFFANISTLNPVTTSFGVIALIILLFARKLKWKGKVLIHPKVPIPLILVFVSIIFSYAFSLNLVSNIKIVGYIPSDFPSLINPFSGVAMMDLIYLIPSSLLLAIIAYGQTVSLGIIFSKKKNEPYSSEKELFALGIANFVGSFFQSLSIAGSLTRTAVTFEAKSATPMPNIIVACIMIIVLLGLGPVFSYLPISILAAIVISSTRSLFDFTDVFVIAKAKPSDLLQFASTFIVVVFIDVQMGLLVGVAISLLEVLVRAFRPRIAELGLLPYTDTFVSVERFPYVHLLDEILVLRLDGEISFGNVRYVCDSIMKQVETRMNALRMKIEDSNFAAKGGVHGSANSSLPADEVSTDSRIVVTLKHVHHRRHAMVSASRSSSSEHAVTETEFPCLSLAQRRAAKKKDKTHAEDQQHTSTGVTLTSESVNASTNSLKKLTLRALVLDASRVVDIDSTGCRELAALREKLKKLNIKLIFAALSGPVRDTLARYGIDASRLEHMKRPAVTAAAPTATAPNDQPSPPPTSDDAHLAFRDKEARELAADLLSTRHLSVAAAVAELALELKEEEEEEM